MRENVLFACGRAGGFEPARDLSAGGSENSYASRSQSVTGGSTLIAVGDPDEVNDLGFRGRVDAAHLRCLYLTAGEDTEF